MAKFVFTYAKNCIIFPLIFVAFGASLGVQKRSKNGLEMAPWHFGPKSPSRTISSEAPWGVCGTR